MSDAKGHTDAFMTSVYHPKRTSKDGGGKATRDVFVQGNCPCRVLENRLLRRSLTRH